MPDPEPLTPRHVFVYGTLRAGGTNDIRRYRPPPQWVGQGAVAGTLYDLGAYPGITLGGEGRVIGEVYTVCDDVEAALDRLEEVRDDGSGEYRRRRVRVPVAGIGDVDCLVYEIHPDRVRAAPVIASGDWLEHRAPQA
ncbi:MAG: gamma-glutamylcyclotransferase [Proteobacteria bacterium]|nr:gamma-glutamylcyclotransferase [Pseudomonadota bacterium]